MSRLDRIKQELAWLKVVFAIFAAIDVSLLAWLAQNYEDSSEKLVIFSLLGFFIISAVIVWVNRIAIKYFKKLEKL